MERLDSLERMLVPLQAAGHTDDRAPLFIGHRVRPAVVDIQMQVEHLAGAAFGQGPLGEHRRGFHPDFVRVTGHKPHNTRDQGGIEAGLVLLVAGVAVKEHHRLLPCQLAEQEGQDHGAAEPEHDGHAFGMMAADMPDRPALHSEISGKVFLLGGIPPVREIFHREAG